MVRKQRSSPISITYPIDLAELNASIAGQTIKAFGRPFWSRNWLDDIPKELRLMIYEHYFSKCSPFIHASPNCEYVHENDKTNHDLIFPECPKSTNKKSLDEIRRSHKNLFFVSKAVKDEAYEVYLNWSVFCLSVETCTMEANFLQYQPVSMIAWFADMATESEKLPKLANITKSFASKRKLSLLGISYQFDASEEDLPSDGANAIAQLILHLKDINAQCIFIKLYISCMNDKDTGDTYVLISSKDSLPRPPCYPTKNTSKRKMDFLEKIEIYAPEKKIAELVRDFFVDAMVVEDECYICKITYFEIFTTYILGKEGRERKPMWELQAARIEDIRREMRKNLEE